MPTHLPQFLFFTLRSQGGKMGEDMKWKKIKEHNVLTYRSFKIMPQPLDQRNECCRNKPLHKLLTQQSCFLYFFEGIQGQMEVNNEVGTEPKPTDSESLLVFYTRHKYGCILGMVTSATLPCKDITAVPQSHQHTFITTYFLSLDYI